MGTKTKHGRFHVRPWKFTLMVALPVGIALALLLYFLVLGPLVNVCHIYNLLSIAFSDVISLLLVQISACQLQHLWR